MLTDEAKIKIQAGRGGNGVVSFRRESKGRRFGKPDGGNGGAGGSIKIVCDDHQKTLADFRRLKNFKAGNGKSGSQNKRTGNDGEDLILEVPRGTIVYEIKKSEIRSTKSETVSKFDIRNSKFPPGKVKTTRLMRIADLKEGNQEITICKGGRGGFGNAHFCTATVRAPKKRTLGSLGQKKTIFLEIKILADIGLIGLANAGKSTLLSRITKARPKIAAYPFTTLEPNLGVVKIYEKNYIVADIPGLIEGAYLGRGLGDRFLRHIERCNKLIHLIDGGSNNIVKDYRTVRNELGMFANKLLNKQEIVVISKIDTLSEKEIKSQESKLEKKLALKPIPISAATGEGIDELLRELIK